MKDGPEKDRYLCHEILRYLDQCQRFAKPHQDAASLANSDGDYAIVQRDLEQIGEGIKNLSPAAKLYLKQKEIPVEAIMGFRNHLAHPYFDLEPSFIFPVCQNDLAPLKQAIESYLSTLPK
jgi:uncharacterized protein with HEPN domain